MEGALQGTDNIGGTAASSIHFGRREAGGGRRVAPNARTLLSAMYTLLKNFRGARSQLH